MLMSDSQNNHSSGICELPEISNTSSTIPSNLIVYKKRWLMLILFIACYACLIFHYLQFNIIANIVVEFYGVSYEAVDWSAMIILLLYAPCSLPTMHITNKIGLRGSILTAMVGVCAASWIKVGSVAPDRYWVVMIAQCIIGVFQVLIILQPSQIASAWFAAEQTSLACGLAVIGNQIGITLGSYLPTVLIHYSKDKDAIASEMNILNLGLAIVCTVVCILVFAFFQSKPATPPSGAQEQLGSVGKLQFKESTVLLFKNSSYVVFLCGYVISIGVYYAVPILLNQIVLQYYPGATEEVGRLSLVINITGGFACLMCGYVLGKEQQYRRTTVSIFGLFLLGGVMFTLAPLYSLIAVYIATVVFGFFMGATYSISLEVVAGLTYPVPESTSSGYILAIGQIVGIAYTYLYSSLFYNFGIIWANTGMCITLAIGTILIIMVKFKNRRQVAEELCKKG